MRAIGVGQSSEVRWDLKEAPAHSLWFGCDPLSGATPGEQRHTRDSPPGWCVHPDRPRDHRVPPLPRRIDCIGGDPCESIGEWLSDYPSRYSSCGWRTVTTGVLCFTGVWVFRLTGASGDRLIGFTPSGESCRIVAEKIPLVGGHRRSVDRLGCASRLPLCRQGFR